MKKKANLCGLGGYSPCVVLATSTPPKSKGSTSNQQSSIQFNPLPISLLIFVPPVLPNLCTKSVQFPLVWCGQLRNHSDISSSLINGIAGPSKSSSLLHDPLHRDLRTTADSTTKPSFLDLPHHQRHTSKNRELSVLSPLDGHLANQPLNLELYNPMTSNNVNNSNKTGRPQKLDSRPGTAATTRERLTGSSRVYNYPQHQKQSSTASLAEFLKTTGPEDLDLRKDELFGHASASVSNQ
jgi:hypothetical protein